MQFSKAKNVISAPKRFAFGFQEGPILVPILTVGIGFVECGKSLSQMSVKTEQWSKNVYKLM